MLKSKDAYAQWFSLCANFPKAHRYTLGGKIEAYFLELLEGIFIALYQPPQEKVRCLARSIVKLDGVKFFLQLAWERKCIATDKYASLSASLEEIGKMLGGWKKGLENKTPPT